MYPCLGADSLCEGSDREYVNFRENALGSCLLRLGLQELTDCDNLRCVNKGVVQVT